MVINVKWMDSNRTCLQFTFANGWSWSDMQAAAQEALQLTAPVTHEVDLVLDLRRAHITPTNPSLPIHILLDAQPSNLGYIYFIGASNLVKALVRVYCGMHPAMSDKVVFISNGKRTVSTNDDRRGPQTSSSSG